jgi:hypothetical protein
MTIVIVVAVAVDVLGLERKSARLGRMRRKYVWGQAQRRPLRACTTLLHARLEAARSAHVLKGDCIAGRRACCHGPGGEMKPD